MSGWDKLSALSAASAAIVIPLAVAFIGNEYSQALKERELQGKFVEIALDILRHDPTDKTQSSSVRLWATKVIDKYSGVPFPEAAREDLINKVPISSRLYGLSGSGEIEKINDLGGTLNSAIKEKRNVVIYIHGKARDPEKFNETFKEIADEIKSYGLKLISFKWQTHPALWEPASKDVIDSVEELKNTLDNLQAYKREHPEAMSIRYTLLAHSFGVRVLKELIDTYSARSLDKSLISNIVITSPAVDSKNHSIWIDKIDFSDRIYIIVNHQDSVLSIYGKSTGHIQLGQKAIPPLSIKAIYIDVSELGVNHRYFAPYAQEQSFHLCQFYKSVLNGDEPQLVTGLNVSRIQDKRIYWIKPEEDISGKCIRLDREKDGG